LAESAQYPEVKKELLWLAEGYERLASAPDIRRMAEGAPGARNRGRTGTGEAAG